MGDVEAVVFILWLSYFSAAVALALLTSVVGDIDDKSSLSRLAFDLAAFTALPLSLLLACAQ